MKQQVAKSLADWVVNLRSEELPEEVLAKAEDCILDAIACAVPGSRAEGAQRIHSVARSTFGKGNAVLWFSSEGIHPTGAAFANAASVSILDIDDGHRRAQGHPGAAIVPAALATVTADTKGTELLASIVAGYEVGIRMAGAERRNAYHTGNWSGFGAAVAAGYPAGLDADRHMNALTITAYHGPRVSDLTLSQDMGANVKESIPWSVVTGLMAKDMAAKGFTGNQDALDIEERYDPTAALEGLKDGYFQSFDIRTSHAITRSYFKRYSCCRWIHTPIEGLLEILRKQNLSIEEIQEIRVETFRQGASLDNLADPPSAESAQYSIPYCMALAATLGEKALSPMSLDNLHNPKVVALAQKIKVARVERYDLVYPATTPSKDIVTTAKGTYDVLISKPWGEPDHPPSRADLVNKFQTLARGWLTDDQVTNIVTAIAGLRTGTVGPLLDALRFAVVSPERWPERLPEPRLECRNERINKLCTF